MNLDRQRLKTVSESPSLKEKSDLFQLFVLKLKLTTKARSERQENLRSEARTHAPRNSLRSPVKHNK